MSPLFWNAVVTQLRQIPTVLIAVGIQSLGTLCEFKFTIPQVRQALDQFPEVNSTEKTRANSWCVVELWGPGSPHGFFSSLSVGCLFGAFLQHDTTETKTFSWSLVLKHILTHSWLKTPIRNSVCTSGKNSLDKNCLAREYRPSHKHCGLACILGLLTSSNRQVSLTVRLLRNVPPGMVPPH